MKKEKVALNKNSERMAKILVPINLLFLLVVLFFGFILLFSNLFWGLIILILGLLYLARTIWLIKNKKWAYLLGA